MAGGKETPRQKLIGLMYLVLLALLALQVSSSVLDKFWTLETSLKGSKDVAVNNNTKKLESIKKAVGDAGSRSDDVETHKKATAVRDLTDSTLVKLEAMKSDLIELTGGTEENIPVGMKNEDVVAEYMILNKNGQKLKELLNEYNQHLIDVVGDEDFKPAPIAKEPSDDDNIRDKKQKKKSFASYNFEQTPLIAALPTISQFESEVMTRETEALKRLGDQVGASDLKFDNFSLIANPVSEVVAAGTKYSANLIVAATATSITPDMTVGGRKIAVDGGSKFGKVEFTAVGGGYDKDGRAQKSYKARAVLSQGGVDKIVEAIIPYTVVKPVMQIQSASVNALYLNCGNDIVVNVPALGSAYNPSFSGSGAAFRRGAKKGMVTIVPEATRKVKMNVSSSGNLIGSQEFGVRKVPKPEIVTAHGSTKRKIDLKKGFSKTLPSSIVVKADPDEGFKQFLPKDARYKILEMDIILARNNKPKKGGRMQVKKRANQVRTSGTKVSLGNLRQISKPGDQLLIEIKKVVRINYNNEQEDVILPRTFYAFPVN